MSETITTRPILFSAPMVRAILAGRKTQTRRQVKPQPPVPDSEIIITSGGGRIRWDGGVVECPYGQPGERLWVRETFSIIPEMKPSGYFTNPKWIDRKCWYAADNDKPTWGGKWRPSIFMPRSMSRITLKITDVRVERLQEISEEDADSEGTPMHTPSCQRFPNGPVQRENRSADGSYAGLDECQCGGYSPQELFGHLWGEINGDGSWEANPWVWAVTFKRIQG